MVCQPIGVFLFHFTWLTLGLGGRLLNQFDMGAEMCVAGPAVTNSSVGYGSQCLCQSPPLPAITLWRIHTSAEGDTCLGVV